jgi:hypothetical protein
VKATLFLLAALATIHPTVVFAIPQYSLLTGNRCNACHVASQGGSLRTELGWYSRSDAALIPPSSPAIAWMYNSSDDNDYLDGRLLLGMDVRVQHTRSVFSTASQRSTFPMQAALHAAWKFSDAIILNGGINLAALQFGDRAARRFPGQQPAHLSAILQPSHEWPSVRVGYFRPTVGMLYDDHTAFATNVVTTGSRRPFLPPNWAEAGAEITYEAPLWLTLQAGVFGTGSLRQVRAPDGQTSLTDGSTPTATMRAVFWPKLADDRVATWVGASHLASGQLGITSAFLGIGLLDVATLMIDNTSVQRDASFRLSNFMAELMFSLHEGAMPYVRYEQGTTQLGSGESSIRREFAESIVLGAQIFPIPYVEVRPEYRIWNTHLPGHVARWNLQLHLYY